MTGERLDTFKLCLFPIMLQAVYNAKKIISAVDERRIAGLDYGDFRPTVEDLAMILRAYSKIGITVPKPVLRNADGTESLQHVCHKSVDEIVEDFNPDVEERDAVIAKLESEKGALRNELNALKAKFAKNATEHNVRKLLRKYERQIKALAQCKAQADKVDTMQNKLSFLIGKIGHIDADKLTDELVSLKNGLKVAKQKLEDAAVLYQDYAAEKKLLNKILEPSP